MSTARGKLGEGIKVAQAFIPERFTGTATTTYYNGVSVTTSAIMVDTRDYDDIEWIPQYGTVLGEVATVSAYVYENTVDNPATATLITGASFTAVNSGSDETFAEGHIKCKDKQRYECMVLDIATASSIPFTVDFAALAVLGKPDTQAVSKTLAFDL